MMIANGPLTLRPSKVKFIFRAVNLHTHMTNVISFMQKLVLIIIKNFKNMN